MTLSATLALSIITNRVWSLMLYLSLQPLRDSVFGDDEERFVWLVAGLGGWFGWAIPLFIVWCWMRRRRVWRHRQLLSRSAPRPCNLRATGETRRPTDQDEVR